MKALSLPSPQKGIYYKAVDGARTFPRGLLKILESGSWSETGHDGHSVMVAEITRDMLSVLDKSLAQATVPLSGKLKRGGGHNKSMHVGKAMWMPDGDPSTTNHQDNKLAKWKARWEISVTPGGIRVGGASGVDILFESGDVLCFNRALLMGTHGGISTSDARLLFLFNSYVVGKRTAKAVASFFGKCARNGVSASKLCSACPATAPPATGFQATGVTAAKEWHKSNPEASSAIGKQYGFQKGNRSSRKEKNDFRCSHLIKKVHPVLKGTNSDGTPNYGSKIWCHCGMSPLSQVWETHLWIKHKEDYLESGATGIPEAYRRELERKVMSYSARKRPAAALKRPSMSKTTRKRPAAALK